MVEISDELKKALIDFYETETSPNTLPPGREGIGGQMITGWISADKFYKLLDALNNSQWLRDYYNSKEFWDSKSD